MTEFLFALVIVLGAALLIQRALQRRRIAKLEREHAESLSSAISDRDRFAAENETLRPFRDVKSATEEAARIRDEVARETTEERRLSNLAARVKQEKADEILASASQQAEAILSAARARAEEIGGDAYRALQNVEDLKRTARAMENVIEGYGDRYLKPTHSLLDELATQYGFDDAGAQLKRAREFTKLMVEQGRAATCEYVETNRRDNAIRFVLDAFNGKVDSILTRVKADNHGTLTQEITDAFALVNHLGSAFRDARITREYLDARIAELKWAAAVQALREKEKEEQRRIKEQIREEEKARREIERALKESAKEEETLQKAMEKVQAQVAKANDEQRQVFEARLAELQIRLAEAEAKNQRALSMAQQTRAGHVYVISNVGSFGENVFKVGMTRRLEPLDRIRELGDASVPFPFDVHALVWSDDAPALETRLHRAMLRCQLNKVNPRKEFFRVNLAMLKAEIEKTDAKATWTLVAEAMEYRETLAIEEKIRVGAPEAREWENEQMRFEAEEALLAASEPEDATSRVEV